MARYKITTIPSYIIDRELYECSFGTGAVAYKTAYTTARTLSYYNHKTTLLVEETAQGENVLVAFRDGYDCEW